MVDGLDALLRETEAAIELPREFVVPGETRLSAALEVARTVIRRAERRTVTLAAADAAFADSLILPYLNRLADLLWILARVAEQAEARQSTVARPSTGSRPIERGVTREERIVTGQPLSPTGQPMSPTQLGVRPAPALVQQLLVGAFGWMFAGLLLTAGVAYLVGGSEQTPRRPSASTGS